MPNASDYCDKTPYSNEKMQFCESMGKKLIWASLVLVLLGVGFKIWLLPNWYSTNSGNVALTYETPIANDEFDALIKKNWTVNAIVLGENCCLAWIEVGIARKFNHCHTAQNQHL